jgi:3-methyl-2-oxobutanoate hydroxymethyltransferase
VSEVRERSFPAAEHTFKPNGPRRPREIDAEIPPHWQTH